MDINKFQKDTIIEITAEIEKLEKEANNLASAISNVTDEEKDLTKSSKELLKTIKGNTEKISALSKKVNEVNTKLKDFNKSIESTNKNTEAGQSKLEKLTEEEKKFASSVKEATTKIKELSKSIKSLITDQTKNKKSVTDNAKAYDSLAKKVDTANKKLKENKDLLSSSIEDSGTKSGKKAKSKKSRNTADQETDSASIDNEGVKNYDKNLNELTETQDKVSKKTKLASQAFTEQNKSSKEVSAILKDVKNAADDTNEAIGVSGEEAKDSTTEINFFGEAGKSITKTYEDLKKSNSDFGDAIADVSKGFNAMQSGFDVVKGGFTGIGSAIKSSGLWLLQLVLEKVYEYFTKNKEGIKQFQGGLAVLQKAIAFVKDTINKIKDAIINAVMHPVDTAKKVWGSFSRFMTDKFSIFSTIGKTIGDAFSHPGEAVKKIWNTIIDNLISRFKGIKVLLEGLFHMDFKKMADGIVQVSTGVTNITDKAAKGFEKLKKNATEAYDNIVGGIKKVYQEGHDKPVENKPKKETTTPKRTSSNANRKAISNNVTSNLTVDIIAQDSQNILKNYSEQINAANKYYDDLKNKHKNSASESKMIEEARVKSIKQINDAFQNESAKKLDEYYAQLNKVSLTARQQAQNQLDEEYELQTKEINKIKDANDSIMFETQQKIDALITEPQNEASKKQIAELTKRQNEAKKIFNDTVNILNQLESKHVKDGKNLNETFDQKDAQETETQAEDKIQKQVDVAKETGHESTAIKKELDLLNTQHNFKVNHEKHTQNELLQINADYTKKKIELENKLTLSRIHAGDKYIDAVLKNTKKDSAIYKAAFLAKKATAIAEVIANTKSAIMASFVGYASMPFIGQALAIAQGAFIGVQGAMSIAEIAKQKPGFAQGGQYVSDGRGALLPGYSRTDNTNAYLRSGEAVVVSEAMRNPWARNLVSAINVAHGGRDFSISNPGRAYAIGGIFTDGGNANRYYSAPVNDQKDLANTLAYQMINNFPPIYVDVKDVNNQQNILAQTVDRVNL